jgi:2-polyprenyl-6-methoxyphenol hydroxylase-like FAD-dependent oxidoreductase
VNAKIIQADLHAEVVIVGAGPVGLALAGELETAGVHGVVLEQLAEPDMLQKARGVGILASEARRRRGLATRLQNRHQAGRVDYRHDMGSDHGHFAWIHKLDQAPPGDQNRMSALIWHLAGRPAGAETVPPGDIRE